MRAPAVADEVPALRPLTGELLLTAWEAASLAHPEPCRPLALLAATLPDADRRALAALPVAGRDLRLLRLRELTFGQDLAVFAGCPQCGERLQFSLRGGELAAQLAAAVAAGPAEWEEDGVGYQLRLATTDDLLAALAAPDPVAAQSVLLSRCLTTNLAPERSLASHFPPPSFPSTAVKRFEALHADTELRCGLDCPGCLRHQVWDLDIARFFWREVDVAARRLLSHVHLLAAAYGWAERDIVRLTPRRRAAYLELVGG
jgi:hypothetical protein